MLGIFARDARGGMDAKAFRHDDDYHFAENRQRWDSTIAGLAFDQYTTQSAGYGRGSAVWINFYVYDHLG
jgi:hypothetical protein